MKPLLTIPLMCKNKKIVRLVFEPHEFGMPDYLTIRIPPECNGVLHLPRKYFSFGEGSDG